jgi:hypothetical protein
MRAADRGRRRAEELAAVVAEIQAVTEAALVARGIRLVSVVHGDPEIAEGADLIYGMPHRLAGECGTLASRIPGWR